MNERTQILWLVDQGKLAEADKMLHIMLRKIDAFMEETYNPFEIEPKRVTMALISENEECKCGSCNTPTPRQYIEMMARLALDGGYQMQVFTDMYGVVEVIPEDMMIPVRCSHCHKIYDLSKVHVTSRYADCRCV